MIFFMFVRVIESKNSPKLSPESIRNELTHVQASILKDIAQFNRSDVVPMQFIALFIINDLRDFIPEVGRRIFEYKNKKVCKFAYRLKFGKYINL